MVKTNKAGCILINPYDKTVALVYREYQNDFSFPKGHVEGNESLIECAIRETTEETKRDCIILNEKPIYIDEYITPSGKDVRLYYFVSKDIGPSNNTSEDTHPTFWVPFDEVYDKLTLERVKDVWLEIKDEIEKYFNR